jgi:hypothetical protein
VTDGHTDGTPSLNGAFVNAVQGSNGKLLKEACTVQHTVWAGCKISRYYM